MTKAKDNFKKHFGSKHTFKTLYLEWLNDWLTDDAMASCYGVEPAIMSRIIDIGRHKHETSLKTN
jgi:hypothetical protein